MGSKWLWLVLGAVLIAFVSRDTWLGVDSTGDAGVSVASPIDPVTARQQTILRRNLGRPGDPELMSVYQAVNARHFSGALPAIAVRWEPALAEIGPLAAQGFTLEGMFGNVGKELIILLNPSVQQDGRALDRALCHEMVHAYLFTIGDKTTSHGPAFSDVLHRLSAEGAFEGIAATDAERVALRAWIDEESARIDFERQQMDDIGREITRERDDLDRDLAAHNARVASANAAGSGWPPADDVRDLEARRSRFNERVATANDRLERDRADLAHFNREVARYNLMIAYPDGIDEQDIVRSKPAIRDGSGG